MSNPFDKEEVKQLKQEWYQKLKQEGFHDIEDTSHPHSPLTSWHACKTRIRLRSTSQEEINSIQEYYSKASALLFTFTFKNDLHRTIWELHSQGLSKREIAKKLQDIPNAPQSTTIWEIINSIRKQMK